MLVARAAVAQPPALPDRAGALVAAGRTFVFYSDAVTNLHDFLVWNARSREPVEPLPDCFARLSAVQRTAFEQAREHYKVFATPAGNRLLLALRYRLAGFGDFGIADAAAIGAAITALKAAAPAYEQCWWPAHDARNLIAGFEAFEGWDAVTRRGIESGNALKLFPRLAQAIARRS